MVEESENGVYPKALEIILCSLSTVPGSQMLLATHSPFVVQQSGVEPLLCFSRDDDGTHITVGLNHQMPSKWNGIPDLGIVFAAGVLERKTCSFMWRMLMLKHYSYTWSENSSITIFVPELEQWLWYCENALLNHCGLTADQLSTWLQEHSKRLGKSVDVLKREQPKELFEFVMREASQANHLSTGF